MFFGYFYKYFYLWWLKLFLQEMLNHRLATVNGFHWGLKPVLIYSKPHTFSTFIGEKKRKYVHFISLTKPLIALSQEKLTKRETCTCQVLSLHRLSDSERLEFIRYKTSTHVFFVYFPFPTDVMFKKLWIQNSMIHTYLGSYIDLSMTNTVTKYLSQ